MDKSVFNEFYEKTIKVIATKYIHDNPNTRFYDNREGLYEEYMMQKSMLHLEYGKDERLLDRHKICACMTVAIIKVRMLSENIDKDSEYVLLNRICANEQLAFIVAWELLKGFIIASNENITNLILPQTFHNDSFEETMSRSLYMANIANSLSAPLIANIYFLLERYTLDICT